YIYKPGVNARDAVLDSIHEFSEVQLAKEAFSRYLESVRNDKQSIDDVIEHLKGIQQQIQSKQTPCYDLLQYRDHALSVKRQYIVEDWLLAGSLHLFAGQQKLGKSSLVFALIGALLTGDKWLDKYQVTQSRVVLLDFENPADYVWE